jgi:voltage-gated potassium channel
MSPLLKETDRPKSIPDQKSDSIKLQLYNIFKEGKEKPIYGKLVDLSIITLIVFNVLATVLESFPEFHLVYQNELDTFENISIIIFTFEYFVRIYISDLNYKLPKGKARLKFILSPMGFIDLLAILPFYLPFFFNLDFRVLRILRVLRIIRILKLNRYSKSLRLMGTVLWERKEDLFLTFFLTLIMLIIFSTLMFFQEGDYQPEAFPNILATFWWAIVTLTTVGYGDVYPITPLGKFLSGMIALCGIVLFALPTGLLTSSFLSKIKKKQKKKKKKHKSYCPHCGEKV